MRSRRSLHMQEERLQWLLPVGWQLRLLDIPVSGKARCLESGLLLNTAPDSRKTGG